MKKSALILALLCASACAEFPAVPEIPKAAVDAVDNAAVFVATIQPVTDACKKANSLATFCDPYMQSASRLERAIVDARRLLVSGDEAQDALVAVRAAMLDVVKVLTSIQVD